MSQIEVISGELESGNWQVFKDRLEKSSFINAQTLFFSDITSITKKEEVAGYVYVDIIMALGKPTFAKMKSKSYMRLYECWNACQGSDKPKDELEGIRQLKAAAAWASNKPIDMNGNNDSDKKKASNSVVKKSKSYTLVVVIFLLIWFISSVSGGDDDEGVLALASQQKESLCKQYIGSIMGRSPKIMYKYQAGDNDTAYIQYQRDDGEYWTYACSFTKDSIVWAGWLNDDSKWGRVMLEDEAKLIYNKPNQIVTIEGHGGLSF